VKVKIEGTQDEFDQKRERLIKALAGTKYKVELNEKGQRKATDPRPAYFKAQKEMIEFWDKKFKNALDEIKREVGEIIGKE
jgi:hypothetical protein